MITFIKTKTGIIISDIIIFLTLYFLPGISHLLPFPLYLLEPMRIAVLTGFILTRNYPNGIILGLTIPLFSTLTTGHPVIFKSILISFELSLNIVLLHLLLKSKRINELLSVFLSIVLSKTLYYLAKFAFIKIGLISGVLVSTNLWPQFYATVVLAVIFGFLFKHNTKSNNHA